MGGAGLPGQVLQRLQRGQRGENHSRFNRRMGCNRGQGAGHFGQVVDPAQPAARFRHAATHPLGQLVDPQARKLRADNPAVSNFSHRDVGNFGGNGRQPLVQRKAGGEILQLGRGRHHHGV